MYENLLNQSNDEVEIIMLMDNKKRSIGHKRNDIKNLAKAKYFTIIDDDDNVSDDYIEEVLKAIEEDKDVITFKQQCNLDGNEFIVTFGQGNEVEQLTQEYQDIKRPPWHCCVWKTDIFQKVMFPSKIDDNYGEDGVWASRAGLIISTSHHIDKVLHYYNFDSEKSEADASSNEHWRNPN